MNLKNQKKIAQPAVTAMGNTLLTIGAVLTTIILAKKKLTTPDTRNKSVQKSMLNIPPTHKPVSTSHETIEATKIKSYVSAKKHQT